MGQQVAVEGGVGLCFVQLRNVSVSDPERRGGVQAWGRPLQAGVRWPAGPV